MILGDLKMDFLYNVSTLFYLLFFLAIVVVIGFLITWLVGKIVKSNTTKKVGKRGSLISGIVMIACLLLAGITNAGYNQIAKSEMNVLQTMLQNTKSYI